MPHIPHSLLKEKIKEAGEVVFVGRDYIHYKYPDRRYRILDIGIQEATEKVCVIYCDTVSPSVHFVRDLDSWLEVVNGIPRFVLA